MAKTDKNQKNFYFPFNVADYSRDTDHLTHGQHGAYMLLILCYYNKGRSLPADLSALYRITRTRTQEEEANVVAVLNEFFKRNDDGTWRHDYIERKLQDIASKRAGSLKANKKRWQDGDPNGYPNEIRTDVRNRSERMSESGSENDPSNSNSYIEDGNSKNDQQIAAAASFLEEKHMATIGPWGMKECRRKMEGFIEHHGRDFTDAAITRAITKNNFDGAVSKIAVLVATYLPAAFAEIGAEKVRAEQKAKEEANIEASVERQTQEIIARRNRSSAVNETSAADIFGSETEN
jgi:uncharacterized protein YdaU (DUF1376 family)